MRCDWAQKPLDIEYHDLEWGTPVHDDRLLFEFLILEGAQGGALRREAQGGADGEPGHRSEPAEDRGGDSERARVRSGAERVRQLRCVCLAVRGWSAQSERLEDAQRASGS